MRDRRSSPITCDRAAYQIDMIVCVSDDISGKDFLAAALVAGGRIVHDANAPEWWTLEDPAGNQADIASG